MGGGVDLDRGLQQIGLGLQIYAAVFDRYPERLEELFPEYVPELRFFQSPFNPTGVKVQSDIEDKSKSNLALARRKVVDVEKALVV